MLQQLTFYDQFNDIGLNKTKSDDLDSNIAVEVVQKSAKVIILYDND